MRDLKKKFQAIHQEIKKPILEGHNTPFDRAVAGLFHWANETGKFFSTERQRQRVYGYLMQRLLEVAPGYESAQPLLGSAEEEAKFLAYKKKRILKLAQPCDVILVRGNQRISRIIQTLTTSPFSHAAIYWGEGMIIEAEPEGILVSPIEKYLHLDLRLSRPVMIDEEGLEKVKTFMIQKLVEQPKYDLANLERLLFKYLYVKFRPDTKVYLGGNTDFEQYYICSGLIAHAFHVAGYPVSPTMRFLNPKTPLNIPLEEPKDFLRLVVHHAKNYSQITPADFDSSPFFASIKYLLLDEVFYSVGVSPQTVVEEPE
ncbi:MAG: hypothetical protein A2600_05450 [Candidatus Lambdaproteobacteria bacterium RIFOXYD1_FULL_56_27]|uniref:Permuted papain-like amidase YaeF/Yiix C92 family enzyme n=1 Tax=Candidatus Lambdaproteobacteria bacterium RIFOXYD2_FULL_56_26 TaxID=1817773 RepID=A0A1F6GR53_9PROT|nr:MAG: hypothetical protein A2426_10660 [Candidatus Lambdaproteobacteria bacterium RIFOXYC1_FULL_56_13]OGH00647.1 MAG: hypothetical protein A2557_03155 [Candidatus Lambdaproteobacteria bacterium RIFOXYD2_FULL_56_26]OGH07813.1 MAG: hypothetical protein A2600_05450 [Candidatus Lambdaproteobacteria bacterium RIFOXYD1_FULL_56_27]